MRHNESFEVAGLGSLFKIIVGGGKVKVSPTKIPTPKMKSSPYGPKVADEVPKNGIPKNWNKQEVRDAISDYKTSIKSRKKELDAFDKTGGGSPTQRVAHARRITEEETFLRTLEKAYV